MGTSTDFLSTLFSNLITMYLRQIACFAALFFGANYLFAQKNLAISSPNKQIIFEFSVVAGKPEYSVKFKGQKLVEHSALSLAFNDGEIGNKVSMQKPAISKGVEEYDLPLGKTSHVRSAYTQVIIPLQEGDKKVNLQVRVFDDGLGIRYQFPQQNSQDSLVLTEERTNFNLSNNPVARVAFLDNYFTSHEHLYNVLPLADIKNDTLMDMPVLFEYPNKVYMAITEANLRNYAGMSLIKKNGMLTSQLTPLPGQNEIKVKVILPHQSPWRVMMISDRIGTLIESNILTSLSEPSMVKDVSWLKPGKATFHWWNGDISPDTTWEPGLNYDFEKYYIDFCARNNIEFHTVIGYRQVAWYKNDGEQYAPGPNTDITKPHPGLDIQAISDYARSKGVRLRFWVHWQALYPKLDEAFTLFEKWGIAGMMVDFMDRDDQEMVKMQEEILQKAAAHHLEIQFHGAYKPTGLSRTYPNESTREGTLNYENDKWGNLITPDDDINIPFTRGLAGCTDYHLGGFRAMPKDSFVVQTLRPHVLATRAHMLAMYIVLENHMAMVCDEPKAYEGEPGFDLLTKLPTTWDETIVPAAKVAQWVSVARRKGKDWYIGVINNSTARQVSIPLGFLPAGSFEATIYKDGADAVHHPNALLQENTTMTASSKLSLHLPSGGGAVIKFTTK